MAKFLLENFLIILIGGLLLFGIILPAFTRYKFFWFFRGSNKGSEDLNKVVDKTVSEFKEVKNKVAENLQDAQELNNKTTNL